MQRPTRPRLLLSTAAAIDKLLARPDLQFMARRNVASTDDEPVPTCISESGDGFAAPGRRYLEVARAFRNDGVATLICEDQYEFPVGALLDRLSEQFAKKPNDGVQTCGQTKYVFSP